MAPVRDRRTGFSRRRQYSVFLGYVLAVAGAAVGAVLLVVSAINPSLFAGLRMAGASVTAPVSSVASASVGAVAGLPGTVADFFTTYRQNRDMAEQLRRQNALLTRARVIAYDNRRLRALLRLRDRAPAAVVSARLVSSTAASGRRFAVLNAGSFSGVRVGMPVRGPVGLVGRVTEVGPNAARVLLLVDPESIVPVRRTRDGAPAIAVGRGDGSLDIRSVNIANLQYRAGDLFVTSGTGGLYMPGVPVARVLRAGSDTVRARPFSAPDTLDFALVEQPFLPMPVPTP
jgi:rod shape-determining protein MreC